MAYELKAKAIVKGKAMDTEISPDPMLFESIPDAIKAFTEWAEGGFWPATAAPSEVTFSLSTIKGEG